METTHTNTDTSDNIDDYNITLDETFQHTLQENYDAHDQSSESEVIGSFWDSIKTDCYESYHSLLETFRYYQIPEVIESLKKTCPIDINADRVYHDLEAFSCFLTRIQNQLRDNYHSLVEKENLLISKIKKHETLISHIQNLEIFEEFIESSDNTIKYQEIIKSITKEINETKDNAIIKDLELYLKLFHFHKNYVYKLHKLKVLQNKPLCPICFTNEIDTVLIPCGHTLCSQCYNSIQSRQIDDTEDEVSVSCAICRNPVNFEQKIYFS